MKLFVISINAIMLFVSALLTAQQPQKTWELSAPETDNKAYIARDYITLKPGFSYKSTGDNTFSAKIDEYLLFPPSGATYGNAGGAVGSTPSAGGMVGTVEGVYGVSPTGAATYTIPIEVPAGVNGMQPNISLVYNSQSGNGIAGWGWNLGGMSMISRTPKNHYYDGEVGNIDWTKESPLMLDGQRLIKISDTEYRTENESISKITAESIQPWGPEVIKVQTKEGLIMEYGKKGIPISYSPISSTKRLGWLLSKVYDQLGNYVIYNYSYGSGVTYKDLALQSVTYGSGASGQEKEIGKISFTYDLRTDIIEGYLDGTATRNNRRLNSIEVYSNGSIYRRFALVYTTCNIQKSRLQSVDCYNGAGEKVTPTNISWNNTNTNIVVKSADAFIGNSSGINAKDKYWYSSDIDGDGISELVAMYRYHDYSGQYWTYFDTYKLDNNSGSLSFQYHQFYKSPEINFDLNGMKSLIDGVSSIKFTDLENPWMVLPVFSKVENVRNVLFYDLKSKLMNYVVLKPAANAMPPYGFGDMNNDGFDDIIVIDQSKSNDKYPLYVLYGNPDEKRIFQEIPTLNFNGRPDKLFISDLNADGLNDLLVVTDKGYNIVWNKGGSIMDNGVLKTEFSIGSSSTTLFNSNCSVIKQGDFNGDGLQDFIVNEKNSSIWYFAINNGNGFFLRQNLPTITAMEESFTGKNDDKDQCLVMDFNNDGKDDVIIVESDYKKENSNWPSSGVNGTFRSSYVAWYKSTGTGVSQVKKLQTNKEDYCYTNYTTLGDFDGDGRLELLSFSSNLYSAVNKDVDKFFLHSAVNTGFSEGLVTSITDGMNNAVSFNYKPLTDKSVYAIESVDKGSSPVFRLREPLYVASNATLSRNGSKFEQYEYSYKTALFHTTGKGLLGFLKTNSKESYSGLETRVVNNLNTTYSTILPYSSEKLVNGNSSGKSTNEISLMSLGFKRFVSRLISVKEENKLNGTTTITSYSNYDSYGNPKTVKKDYGGGISETQSLVYTTAGSWCDNKVKSISTTRTNAGASETLTASYDYYDFGKIKTHIVNPGKDKFQITNSYEYDGFGNLTKETVFNNGDSRSVSRTYSPSGRFLKTETNNQLKETVIYNFNEYTGTLTSMVTPSGTTKYAYDGFGRITEVEYPDKNRKATTRQWAANTVYNAVYYVYEESTGTGSVKTWYDAQGRELRRDFYSLGGKETYIKTEYNNKGQLYRVSEPYFGSAPTKWSATYTYDSYGRTVTETTQLGATSYSYNGLKTTVTSPSGTVETTLNSAGQVMTNRENGKTVTFKYHPSGKIASATPEDGLAVTYQYDILGYPTEVNDPNTGKITYLYNGFGEIMEQSRPIHIGEPEVVTIYEYHPTTKLPESMSVNGQTTTYAYDSRNRLKSETISGVHSRTYDYDDYDRPIRLTENIAGKNFVSTTAYDAYGRVAKETFPSGYFITNAFDEYGHHSSVSDSKGTKIWEAKEADTFGRLTKYNQGGKTTTMTYHANTGLPTSIVGSISFYYIYNGKGQLELRSDGRTGQKEVFAYDGMSRLDGWTLTIPGEDSQVYEMTYDSRTGGIESKPNVDYRMSYGGIGNPPHALTSVAGVSDEMKNHVPQTITYNDYNKVSSITQGNKTYNLTYGTYRQRVKSVSEESGSTKQTKYYVGNYEEEVDADGNIRKLHYIYGSNTLAAIMEHKRGQENLYYTYTDYQGNLMAVTDATGSVKERYAYDAWGLRRNPANWTKTDTRISFLFSRGYTLHEHLDDFGLINMNGRVYDPLMAQFLSPDPYIQSPGNWMNYNRYAYCYNNPLIYTDPDGEFFWAALPLMVKIGIGIGAGVGAYTGYKIADSKGVSGLGMVGYMLGGAAIGGLSGYFGGTIAAGGGFMANTSAIMAGSYTNSMGMAMLSGGDMSPSISFGVASFNFGSVEWGYLGKKGNSALENIGYGLGALANLNDFNNLINQTTSTLYTQKRYQDGSKDYVSHSGIVEDATGDKLMSFGPIGNNSGVGRVYDNMVDQIGDIKSIKPLGNYKKFGVSIRNSTTGYDVPMSLSKSQSVVVNKHLFSGLRGVSKIIPYQGITTNCVNMSSIGLWLNGIPNIGIHPYLLHYSTAAYYGGFRPAIFSFHLNNF